MQSPCARRVLAAGDFSSIEECTCGSVHVTVGAVTLRLQPGAFAALASVVDDAARALVLGRALRRETTRPETMS